jgi:hypothetical protein
VAAACDDPRSKLLNARKDKILSYIPWQPRKLAEH